MKFGGDALDISQLLLPIVFSLLGYSSGSVLYARIFAKIFNKKDMLEKSRDQNPGAANAFQYGGFWCGIFTLLGDLAKGFVPVYTFMYIASEEYLHMIPTALVIAAPVIGHIFPAFYHFEGGKGIAATFGVLLGLLPHWKPLVVLVVLFVFFSSVIRITPHFYRTGVTYLLALVGMFLFTDEIAIFLGFLLITACVIARLFSSKEERKKPGVKLLWMC